MLKMGSASAEIATLNERVSAALADNPYLSTRHQLNFTAVRGRVTLHGAVNTFFQKQMVQESLRGIDGVDEIENQLHVVPHGLTSAVSADSLG